MSEFARGYFAFYISGPWNIGEFQRRLPASLQTSWMTAPMPGLEGPGTSLAGGASLVVFATSPRKRAAWQLVQYLSRPEVQLRFHALTGNLPPRRTAWNDEKLQANVYARAFREQLERVEPAPMVPEWERIASEMQTVAEQMVHDPHMTIDAAAAEIDGAPTASWRSGAGCLHGGNSREAQLGRVGVRGARAHCHCRLLLPAGGGGMRLSFTDFDIYALADIRNLRCIGLANYVELLQTPLFWKALGNTLYFVGVGVPLSIALSLATALLLNSKLAA